MKKIKVIFLSIFILFSSQLFAQDNTEPLDGPKGSIESSKTKLVLHGLEVSVLENSVVTFESTAQVLIRLKENKLNGTLVKITNKNETFIKSFLVNDNLLFATLPLNDEYICTYENDNYILSTINTTPQLNNETIELTEWMIGVFTYNQDFRNQKIDILSAMDSHPEISYFEKLKFMQHHYLKGKPMPNNLIVPTDQKLTQSFCKQPIRNILLPSNKKTRGDQYPWSEIGWEAQLDQDGNPINETNLIPCRTSLTMNHVAIISMWVGQSTLTNPYVVKNYFITPGQHQWTGGGNREDSKDVDKKGASVNKKLFNHGWWTLWLGHAGFEVVSLQDATAFQRIIYHMIATSKGYFSKNCGCQKRINTNWKYETSINVKTDVIGGGGFKHSVSHAKDEATAFILSMDNGAVEIIAEATAEAQMSCKKTLNDAWATSMEQTAKDLAGIAVIIAAGWNSGQTGNATWADIFKDPTHITSLAGDLSNLLNTHMYNYEGECGDKTNDVLLINTAKDIYISPGQTFALVLQSKQLQEVQGVKHWASENSILSNGFIATYTYPFGSPTGIIADPIDCCSKQMGEWVQTGLTTQAENTNLYEISNYLTVMGYNWEPNYKIGNSVNALGNYACIFGAKPEGCSRDIELGGRKSNPALLNATDNFQIYQTENNSLEIILTENWKNSKILLADLSGKILNTQNAAELNKVNINTSNLPKGIYLLSISNGVETKTVKLSL